MRCPVWAADRQSDGEVSLAGSGRPEEDDIGRVGQERAGTQAGDHVQVQRWLVIGVEVL